MSGSKSQDVVISRKVGNHSNTEKRAVNGRKGRGQDAFTAKVRDDEDELQKRIEAVIRKAKKSQGAAVSGRFVLRLPLKVFKVG